MNVRLVAVLLCVCLLPACGGGGDPQELADAGAEALSSGKYEDAAESYEEALEKIGSDTAHADWKRSKMGWIQAQVRIDATRAKQEFLDFASASPSKVTDNDFSLIGSKLGDAGKLSEALEVLTVGMEAHSESPHLKLLLTDLGKRAESSGDAGLLDQLKGLGYVGED